MQITGEELIRGVQGMETRHSSDQSAVAEAPDTLVTNGYTTSNTQFAWVRVATAPNRPAQAEKTILSQEPVTSSEREEIARIIQLGENVSDIREGIVASLRERIESGTYFVGAETIAEMMVRRTLADRLR